MIINQLPHTFPTLHIVPFPLAMIQIIVHYRAPDKCTGNQQHLYITFVLISLLSLVIIYLWAKILMTLFWADHRNINFFNFFLLLFKYSFLPFLFTAPDHPSLPHLPPLFPPLLVIIHMSFIIVPETCQCNLKVYLPLWIQQIMYILLKIFSR